jgi:hypothetical protein
MDSGAPRMVGSVAAFTPHATCVTRLAHAELHLHTHTPLSTHMSASALADPNDRTQRGFERRMCMQLNPVVAVPTSTSPAQQRVKYGAALSKGVACVQRPNLNVYGQPYELMRPTSQKHGLQALGVSGAAPELRQIRCRAGQTVYVWLRQPCCPAPSPPLPPAWCHAELLQPLLLVPARSQCRASNPAIPPRRGPALASPTPLSTHAATVAQGPPVGHIQCSIFWHKANTLLNGVHNHGISSCTCRSA